MEVPGLMCPVLKLPARVAVCATRLVLEKVTSDPLAIVRVGGWKAKWLISTVEARLASAVPPAEAISPRRPTSASAKTTAAIAIASLCQVLLELRVVVINAEYAARWGLVQGTSNNELSRGA